jgi:hypothetical protein
LSDFSQAIKKRLYSGKFLPIFKKQKKVKVSVVMLDSITFKYHRHAGAQKRRRGSLKRKKHTGTND